MIHEGVKSFHSYTVNVHSLLILKLMKGGAHAASCLGILGICEPIANCVISTNLLLSQSGFVQEFM